MLYCLQIGEIARRSEGRRAGMKKTLVAAILVLVLGAGTFGQQVDPFEGLNGPVAKVEQWSYKTEEKFGDTVEVWDAHSVETYDANQNCIELIGYKKTGSIDERYVRTFDSNGRLIQVDKYNWLGHLVSKSLVQYEENLQIFRSYNADGDLDSALDYELDADGKWVRSTDYDVETGDVSEVWEFSYTREGEPSSARIYNDKGELSASADYRYDVDSMDAVSNFVAYLFGIEFMRSEIGTLLVEIDEYGNWTEKRSYKHKERFGKVEWVLLAIYRREITYR
jgi:hypothetical protein